MIKENVPAAKVENKLSFPRSWVLVVLLALVSCKIFRVLSANFDFMKLLHIGFQCVQLGSIASINIKENTSTICLVLNMKGIKLVFESFACFVKKWILVIFTFSLPFSKKWWKMNKGKEKCPGILEANRWDIGNSKLLSSYAHYFILSMFLIKACYSWSQNTNVNSFF